MENDDKIITVGALIEQLKQFDNEIFHKEMGFDVNGKYN